MNGLRFSISSAYSSLGSKGVYWSENGRMVRTPRRRRPVQRDIIVNDTIRAVIERAGLPG